MKRASGKRVSNTVFCHADGSCRWHVTNAVPLTDDAGKIIGFQGCASDITERKRAEMRLRASEEMLNTVFDQTFQFMGLLDTEGRVVIANKVALDFVGQTESDVIGKTVLGNALVVSFTKGAGQSERCHNKGIQGQVCRIRNNPCQWRRRYPSD